LIAQVWLFLHCALQVAAALLQRYCAVRQSLQWKEQLAVVPQ